MKSLLPIHFQKILACNSGQDNKRQMVTKHTKSEQRKRTFKFCTAWEHRHIGMKLPEQRLAD